jgi:hypothetical protein
MPANRVNEAWRLAQEMAQSGQYLLATTVEDILSSMGYEREVDSWKGKWEEQQLTRCLAATPMAAPPSSS